MAKMGRPKKEINQKMFETLCACQCTEEDICDQFEVDKNTLNRWCRENYNGNTFSQVFKEKRKHGLNSLRARQYKAAMDGNTSMMIFLGKNYLGQSDKVEQTIAYSDDETVKELYAELKGKTEAD